MDRNVPGQVVDRLVGHVLREMVVGVAQRRLDRFVTGIHHRRKVVGIRRHEDVGMVETVVRGPVGVRPRLVDVVARRVVPLADGVSAPPVMLGGLGDFLGGHRYPARIARETHRRQRV